MSGVDNRVVNMQFNNSQFEKGVSTTLSTLDKLKNALMFKSSNKGMEDLQKTANGFNLGHLEGGVTSVSKSFLAMSAVALTAIAGITTKAMAAGTQLVKSFTIQPLAAGFQEYELKMGSIQTILSNTARYGTSLADVTKNLDALNTYADKTIYSFGDMTKNIGLFTNAGIRIEDATSMIKGFSNEAASSGTNAQGAASAAYQLSQALSAGTIRLMDWRSLQNVGMGNKNMQNGLIEIADAMGTVSASGTNAAAIQKNFNGSLEKGWLSADVMSSYLKIMAGDMSEAEQKSLGLTDAQIQGFAKQQKMSEDAATKVRTFTQLMGTLREAAGSSWAESFNTIIGDFNQATDLWTSVNNTLGGMLQKWGDARNELLKGWADKGGRDVAIEALSNAFKALMAILKPIGQAFRDIFPAKTAQDLYNLTAKVRDFTEKLMISGESADKIRSIFKGVFAVFSIAKQIIGGIIGVIGRLVGTITDGSGGFLTFVANIGEFIARIDQALKSGTGLSTFFDNLGSVLEVPVKILKAIAGFIGDLFSGFDQGAADSAEGSFGRIADRLSPLQKLIEGVKAAFGGLTGIFEKLGQAAQPVIDFLSDALSGLGEAIGESFSSGNFDQILDLVNTGLFGGLVLLVKKFLDGGGMFGHSGVTEMFGSIAGTFKSLTGVLTTMQQNVKADILLKIAGALALLTLSIVALALIDSDKLTKSLTAIGVAFAELLGAMKILETIGESKGYLKMPAIAASMIALSIAILILTFAVRSLSKLGWADMAKGLLGVAGLMVILSKAVKPLSANSKGLISAGLAMIVLAVGLKVMASSVKDFAAISWGDLIHGLIGISGALMVVAAAMRRMPRNMAAQAAAIAILAGGLKILASAIEDFGSMDWGTIGKGLGTIAASLRIIAGAMKLMPKDILVQAAGLVVLSAALLGIGKAIEQMGGMSWTELAKGLIGLGGALLILVVGLKKMEATIAGSAALLIAALALGAITAVLVTLGSMSLGSLVTSLIALAAIFVILGVAGYALAPVSPILLLIGAALLMMGAALMLVGAGALMFASAMAILVGIAGQVYGAITSVLGAIIAKIPEALKAFGEGIVAFAGAIAKGGPQFVAAMTTILLSILQAIQQAAPQIGRTMQAMINMLLGVLVNSIPAMARAGLRILLGVLSGIADNIYKIVTVAIRIVTRFIDGIADNLHLIIRSGANLIIKFVNGVATEMNRSSEELGRAGARLAGAIISGMARGIWGGISTVASAAAGVAKRALNSALSFLGIHSPSTKFIEVGAWSMLGWAKGTNDNGYKVVDSVVDTGKQALNSLRSVMAHISDEAAIDANPVITPVLDLTEFRKNANQIQGAFTSPSITPTISASQATAISTEQVAAVATGTSPFNQETPSIKFEQNNYSPKALSAFEIYRNTRNQLDLAKEALSI